MKVDRPTVEKVARLAHLTLSEEETVYYQSHLSKIVGYMKDLDQCEGDVESDWRADTCRKATVEREDEVKPSLPADDFLSEAPEKIGTAFKVPRIIGGES